MFCCWDVDLLGIWEGIDPSKSGARVALEISCVGMSSLQSGRWRLGDL